MVGSYIGKGDTFSFGKGGSFAGEHVSGRDFGIKFTNTSSQDKVIALSPAVLFGMPIPDLVSKVSGIDGWVTEDGTLADADGSRTLSGLPDRAAGTTGAVTANSLDSQNTIDFLLSYAAVNPVRVVRLELNSTKKGQFSNRIEQRIITPFSTTNEDLSIPLRKYVDADQFQEDRTEIPLIKEGKELCLSFDSVIYFKLAADSEFEVNMDLGAIDNGAENLRTRARIAHRNIVAARGASVQTRK